MEVKETEKIDVTKYVGTKVLIVKAQFQESKHGETLFLQSEINDVFVEQAISGAKYEYERGMLDKNKFHEWKEYVNQFIQK